MKALNNYVFEVEDRRSGTINDIHRTRPKFYSDDFLNQTAIMQHVVKSEHGMPVSRTQNLIETEQGLAILVRWKGFPDSPDSIEPLQQVYEDVPQLLFKLFNRKITPASLVSEDREQLKL